MKKWLAIAMAAAMVAAMPMAAMAEEAETEVAGDVTTVGPEDGTHFELWSFVDVHNNFYANMVNEWNEENPDRPIQITFTTYPYSDMHNKLMMSLQAGSGAPDMCDVEISHFPEYLGDDTPLYDITDAMAPYEEDMVKARLDIYSRGDGTRVGVPTHVGASMMYWNAEIFEQYGLDYKSVKTWDEYTELGRQLRDASNGEVFLTSVDTGGCDWLWIAMAQYGEDWTNFPDGPVDVQLDSIKKMLNMQKQWLDEGIAMISTDGHVDCEAGYKNVADGLIASFPKAEWYMSRFINYMPEMEGKYDLGMVPTFEEGQPCCVGLGGTGTVITMQCENPELAAEWLVWAKCSAKGEQHIWDDLGFDVCNKSLWYDDEFANKDTNVYNTFFRVKPHEVLCAIDQAAPIGRIYTTKDSPTINEYFTTTTLNEIFEDGMDIDEALAECQDYLDFELE